MIFCIGNGESRKDFDLHKLREHGKIYGCNGLYRDFTPDILLAMDYNICHEIYRSGYAFDNPVYLRSWEKNPHTLYPKLFEPETVAKFIGQDIDVNDYTDEWSWRGEKKRYFVCWANNRDLMKKMREERKETFNEDDFKLYLSEDQEGYLITWTKKKDKVMGLGKYKEEKTNAGMLIAMMAAEKDKKIYLIGYDYYSKLSTVNNVYKGTKGYVGTNAAAINPENWIFHTKRLLNKFDDHEFIHVGDPVDNLAERHNWTDITYDELNERINSRNL